MDYHVYTISHKQNKALGVYVGSTSNFELRRNNHKCFLNKHRHYNPIYKLIFENGGWSEWEMISVCRVNSRDDVLKMESHFINTLPNVVNVRRPYVEDRKALNNEYSKNYYRMNRDKILEKLRAKSTQKKKLAHSIEDDNRVE